jgi:hypothetical protein
MTAIDMVAKENADYSPKAISCPILAMSDFGTSRHFAGMRNLVAIGAMRTSSRRNQARFICTHPRVPDAVQRSPGDAKHHSVR